MICVCRFLPGQRAELSFSGGGDSFELRREEVFGGVCGHDLGWSPS